MDISLKPFRENQLQRYWKSLQICYKETQAQKNSWELLKEKNASTKRLWQSQFLPKL